MNKVNIAEAFGRIDAPWSPHLAGAVGDCEVKLAKLDCEFVWHQHDAEDEMFLVIKGRHVMRYRNCGGPGQATAEREVLLEEGEFLVIPAGTEHMPFAEEECHVMLFEPKGTVNTGNITNILTAPTS